MLKFKEESTCLSHMVDEHGGIHERGDPLYDPEAEG